MHTSNAAPSNANTRNGIRSNTLLLLDKPIKNRKNRLLSRIAVINEYLVTKIIRLPYLYTLFAVIVQPVFQFGNNFLIFFLIAAHQSG